MNTTYLQLQSTLAGTIYSPDDNILFNETLIQSNDIHYHTQSGTIEFDTVGMYLIDWSIVTANFLDGYSIGLALSSTQGDFITSYTTQNMGEVVGSALIEIRSPGVTVSLVNIDSTILLGNTPVTANLAVYSAQDTSASIINPQFAYTTASLGTIVDNPSDRNVELLVWYGPNYIRVKGDFNLSAGTSTSVARIPFISPTVNSQIYNTVGFLPSPEYRGKWPIFPQSGSLLSCHFFIYMWGSFTPGLTFECKEIATIQTDTSYYFDITFFI